MTALRQAKVPLLFLYGDSDPWIPVAQTVESLKALAGDMHNLEFGVVSAANHEMMTPVNETMEVDPATTRNDQAQAPAYFMLLGSWLARHVLN